MVFIIMFGRTYNAPVDDRNGLAMQLITIDGRENTLLFYYSGKRYGPL